MKNFQRCDRVSYVFFSLAVFLGIAGFLPGGLLPGPLLKGYLVVLCMLVAFVAWLLGRLIEGAFHIPWTPVIAASTILLFSLFLSGIFSQTPYLAFFGEGFDQGTVAVLGSLILGLLIASTLFTTERRIFRFLGIFFILYSVLALFQIVHIFFPALTSLHVFNTAVDTPIGLLSDFALISGAVLLGSTLMLQFMKVAVRERILLIAAGVLALFFVILANIFVVWVLVGLSSVIILVYTLIAKRFSEERLFPFLTFSLTLVALLFILANSLFGSALANLVHLSYVDVHPTFHATAQTALGSLKHDPLFGAGPNRFLKEWLVHRPVATNGNVLWDAPFNSGASFLGTVAILGGAIGILTCLFFLLSFGYEVARKLFVSKADDTRSFLIFGLFMVATYFLCAIVFFSPGIAVTTCALAFIGIFLGSLVGAGRIPLRELNFLGSQRAGFFSILGIVTLLLVSAGVAYASTERFSAAVFFEKSLRSSQSGQLDVADTQLQKAIGLVDLPIFERARIALAEQSVQKILSAPANVASSDAVKATLQNAVSIGNGAARQAVALDPSDPANYIAYGDLLRLLLPLKIDGVKDTAVDAYQKAAAIAPQYPKVYLDLATLYFDAGDNQNARTYIQKALDQKANYTDAFFLLAQVEISDGNTAAAIEKIQNATLIDPNNPDVYFELGLLRYNSGDYANASDAFKTTINLNNQYLNAWYYLALAEEKTGNTSDAADILTALHARLPDNQDVADALAALTTHAQTVTPPAEKPADTKQEKAKKLPLPADKATQ